MRRIILGGTLLLGVLLAQQPGRLLRSGLRSEALGCFELLDSARRTASLSMEGVPPLTRLDSVPDPYPETPSQTTYRRLESIPNTMRLDPVTKIMHPRWSADSLSDTVRLMFTNGFVGGVFALNLPAKSQIDTLSGEGYAFSDLPPPPGKRRGAGAAWAIRRPCPQ
jgi:hypothetical protein